MNEVIILFVIIFIIIIIINNNNSIVNMINFVFLLYACKCVRTVAST